jgi:hypothetical protein
LKHLCKNISVKQLLDTNKVKDVFVVIKDNSSPAVTFIYRGTDCDNSQERKVFDSFTLDKLPHLAHRCLISIVTSYTRKESNRFGMYKREEADRVKHDSLRASSLDISINELCFARNPCRDVALLRLYVFSGDVYSNSLFKFADTCQ